MIRSHQNVRLPILEVNHLSFVGANAKLLGMVVLNLLRTRIEAGDTDAGLPLLMQHETVLCEYFGVSAVTLWQTYCGTHHQEQPSSVKQELLIDQSCNIGQQPRPMIGS